MILPHIRPFARNPAKNVPEAGYGIGVGKFKLVVSERRFLVVGFLVGAFLILTALSSLIALTFPHT